MFTQIFSHGIRAGYLFFFENPTNLGFLLSFLFYFIFLNLGLWRLQASLVILLAYLEPLGIGIVHLGTQSMI